MAGHASNWYKATAGPLKGQAVYLSREQQADSEGNSLSRTEVLARLNGNRGAFRATAIQNKANTAQPKGVALRGLTSVADKAAAPFPANPMSLISLGSPGGSTGADLVTDAATGMKFIKKAGDNAGHVREEVAADGIYAALGIPVPGMKLYETANGPVKLTRFVESTPVYENINPKTVARIQKDFVVDALLANWDISKSGDNIRVGTDGTPWRVDNGGSLRYRARGELKGSAWTDYPTELFTMRKSTSGQRDSIFGSVSFDGIAAQSKALNAKRKILLDATPADVRPRMAARIDNLNKIVAIGTGLRNKGVSDAETDTFLRNLLTSTANARGTLPDTQTAIASYG